MAHVTHGSGSVFGLLGQMTVFNGGLSKRLNQWKRFSETLSELQQLSDRELNDLGLSRSALRGVAWHATLDEAARG
ncbi:DUF1127 domain-containing protein [Actibacterium sp. 188UL27-1]|uniref:DUF1127 domain-containing protein n=1 Tax=Actibacterium sp. 188UL27-1 TaxID=2786961 RepID=UPI00195AFDE2|nr:DUF1127 domain-containing protein [Actibacterium sp. 188UL27-1]MBM7068448.1 DUF1127 domain-containing protein [Actibacterium sp. 188UL27-1]